MRVLLKKNILSIYASTLGYLIFVVQSSLTTSNYYHLSYPTKLDHLRIKKVFIPLQIEPNALPPPPMVKECDLSILYYNTIANCCNIFSILNDVTFSLQFSLGMFQCNFNKDPKTSSRTFFQHTEDLNNKNVQYWNHLLIFLMCLVSV